MVATIFTNGKFVTQRPGDASQVDWHGCMVIDDETIVHVGEETDPEVKQIRTSSGRAATHNTVDLGGRVVAPGFIDGHTHLVHFGLSLQKLDVSGCHSLEAIRSAIRTFAQANPDRARLLCRGWHQPSTGGQALASMLDDLDPRPIFVEALDLHSTWCSTSAMAELPMDEILEKCDPRHVPVDADGRPTGLLAESAQTGYVWPYMFASCTTEEKQAVLSDAFSAMQAAGYTGAIDMAMDEVSWEALALYKEAHGGRLPIHVAAHWFVPYAADDQTKIDDALAEAIRHQKQSPRTTSPDLCVVGIKLISDGVVDGCTAALSKPYAGEDGLTVPLWPAAAMNAVVQKAAAAGLQVAIHAIGDVAIRQAIDAIAAAKTPGGRHRIEHLELPSVDDVQRLGQLGITASIQPVHSDPELCVEYEHIIGPDLWARAFPYKEFVDGPAHDHPGHTRVAIGTDAPTAQFYQALPNLYNATTRRSATCPSMDKRTHPHNALTLAQALVGATAGAAYSRFAESWTGMLAAGKRADFVVLETEWTADSLLEGRIGETWARGQKVYENKKEKTIGAHL